MHLIQWQLSAVLCIFSLCTASPLRYFDQTILSIHEETFVDGIGQLSKPRMHYNLTFDDIDMLELPVEPLDHHFPLDFLRMNVMNTSLAVEDGMLSKNDTNCAVKGTNAIVTVPNKYNSPARVTFDSEVPANYNVSEFFDFKSITFKPIGPVPRFVVAEIHAWRIANGTALKLYTVFAAWGGQGYVNPIVGNFPKFWPGWGEAVNVLEILAYTQERKPWELCIGRIEFDLHEKVDRDARALD